MSMLCLQCEQTFKGSGCVTKGVCGKEADVATLQDVLIHALQSAAIYGAKARVYDATNSTIDYFMMEGLFATLTNVNFDINSIKSMITKAITHRETLKENFEQAYAAKEGKAYSDGYAAIVTWQPANGLEAIAQQGLDLGVHANSTLDADTHSLRDLLLYGLKGMAAYAHHAFRLGQQEKSVTNFIYKALASLADNTLNHDDLLGLVMECGATNLTCLEMLDRGHTTRFGQPEPTQVPLGVQQGKAIVVSGHDLHDLAQLLEQTKDTGLKIYTHGEMLPACAYPKLKKYPHLIGHYGSAWQNQQKEFVNLPAAILMTTNCIQEPDITYEDRIFTTGAVAWPNIGHIPEQAGGQKDFSPVIKKALALEGFREDLLEKTITIGFGHHTVLGAADKIVDAVKSKQLRHFFVIGGCDGARPGRNYYSKFAESVPDDCLILTLGCGKNRLNRLDYPEIAGFPQLLDCGQCNDAYSAVVIAQALAKAFDCGVNDLPLSLIISWYEQKAVAVLLSLLHLGIKNIKLGPSLPAFITPNVLDILVEKFNLQPIKTVEEDLNEILNLETA